jgi:hypothetical protein
MVKGQHFGLMCGLANVPGKQFQEIFLIRNAQDWTVFEIVQVGDLNLTFTCNFG